MKNSIQTVRTVFLVLLVILGFNAFTNAAPDSSIEYEITQGKIEASEINMMIAAIETAKKDLIEMHLQFEDIAGDPDLSEEALPRLTGLSQLMDLYETKLALLETPTTTLEQRYGLIDELKKLRAEFGAAYRASR